MARERDSSARYNTHVFNGQSDSSARFNTPVYGGEGDLTAGLYTLVCRCQGTKKARHHTLAHWLHGDQTGGFNTPDTVARVSKVQDILHLYSRA